MARWEERASERLRHGETIETAVPIGTSGVVVTTQRVFAFTPESDGANFRSVERPNVEGVVTDTTSDTGWLGYVARAALAGVAGVALGLTVDFGSLLDLGGIGGQGASRVGMGGMLTVLQQVSRLLGLLDQVLLVGGLLALAVALGALGMYVESRTKTIRLTVAGGADLHVPASARGDAVARLQRHLADGAAGEPTDAGGERDAPDRGTLGTIRDSLTADTEATGRTVARPAVDAPADDDGPESGDDPDEGANPDATAEESLDFDDEE
ncbi:hypothetical protein [Halorientalis pallida]|uniref:Uncharacterized protein n=1 Tax=Halorientalis pallida TaxID=2479928 RepID=A0A498KYE5_9EURY|nr:hypothetical protein [Halorientalis pallida]RXK50288.1 hypothetical protein EAF64_06930 [Halorientalis pallida]